MSRAPAVLIRPAALADAAAMASVYVQSWRSSYAGIVPRSVLAALSVPHERTYWREALRRPPPGRHSLVAERRGKVVGFATCGPSRDGADREHLGEIYTIYLLAEMQRKGLGRRLMAEAAAQMQADGLKRACVWVLRDNPGRRFYEALAGELDGEKTVSVSGAPLVVVRYVWDETAWLEEAAAGLSGIELPPILNTAE
jgi:GNAT superfamily N-acetyltransferase